MKTLILILLFIQASYGNDYTKKDTDKQIWYQLLPQEIDFQPAIDLIKRCEGFIRVARYDVDSVLVIGYGYRINVQHGQTTTKKQATKWLIADLNYRLKRFRNLITVPINNNQLCALLSLTYNIGIGNFGNSVLLRKLNKFDYDLEQEFKRWNGVICRKENCPIWVCQFGKHKIIYRGLQKRRLLEIKLFNKK